MRLNALQAVQRSATVGEESLAAGELSRWPCVQQNTLSDQLKTLARAAILKPQHRSGSIIYRINPEAVSNLISVWNERTTGSLIEQVSD